MQCKTILEKLQDENRTHEHKYYSRTFDKLFETINKQAFDITELRNKNKDLQKKISELKNIQIDTKEDEVSSVSLLKNIRKESKLLEDSFNKTSKKLTEELLSKNKVLTESNKKLTEKIKTLEGILSENNNKTLNRDDTILYKSKIMEKENVIEQKNEMIEKYKKEIEELKKELTEKVDSDLFVPESSIVIKACDKTLLNTYVKDTPVKKSTVKNKIALDDLFDTTLVPKPNITKPTKIQNQKGTNMTLVKVDQEDTKNKTNPVVFLDKKTESKKPVKKSSKIKENKDNSKKVKTIIENENKSYFQDLSFATSIDNDVTKFNKF
ncbi:hypothetical protein EHP00_851 [Ecytonucleospora hepatopenaei]|uniref:Uncharacterized protein n=1 Tax=Ecytonucleospora hepatopenaei TaxID=646526 RepID=A0A1W0E4Q3_9MICR|nr:hypothetical protein EHP00_851 [Ecytonucleospora hepatopenaei]